jgi:hypothetical protein
VLLNVPGDELFALATVLPATSVAMRARAVWTLAAITGAALSGCGSNWMAEKAQRDAYEEQQNLGMLLERARFELHCPEAQLQVLERFQGSFTDHQLSPATLVGVDGCGRQAMYKRRLRRRYGHGRTTDNTKWEPTGPSPAFAYPAPAPGPAAAPRPPPPAVPAAEPAEAPAPAPPPAVAPAASAPSSPVPTTPSAAPAPPTRVFGAAR